MKTSKRITPRRLSFYISLGIFLGLALFCVQIAPKVFHEEWLKRESAYPLEHEYSSAHIIGRARDALYSLGFSSQNVLQRALYEKQKSIVDEALKKIPQDDGERLIWQLDLDQDFWIQIESRENVPSVMPRVLDYFDTLMEAKFASHWADAEAFVRLNELAAYFFHNYEHAGMDAKQTAYWQRHIVLTMNVWANKLPPEALIQEPSASEQALPLSWNDVLFTGAGMLVIDPKTHEVSFCDKQALKILFEVDARLKTYLDFFKSKNVPSYVASWVRTASMHVNEFSVIAPSIRQHCAIKN